MAFIVPIEAKTPHFISGRHMIVPQYWAESRLQHRAGKKQITLRRFGWSDASPAEAQENADKRAREALERALAGESLQRKEPKIPYNGAAGVPIREEIVSRHGDTVITRNSYGARCLNTPDVLFADIDFQEASSFRLTLGVFLFLLACAGMAGWLADSRLTGIVLAVLALPFTGMISRMMHRGIQKGQGGGEKIARNRIDRFLQAHPAWNLRLYRTPAGMRVMATHKTFNPNDPEVAECFAALGADPLYAAMCLNQQCFRARVSAKPWRIGVQGHLKPRPGVWPVAPERMEERTAWVAGYEKAAASFAACTFIDNAGSGAIHFDIKPVQELHDELCSATAKLPMA